jgi:hypothetical protein
MPFGQTGRMLNLVAPFTVVLVVLWANGPVKEAPLDEVSTLQPSVELAQSSRKAIIETGFSTRYFDEHFRLEETFDKPGDMRVVWRFSMNEYAVRVTDALGYYSENQKRIYVHSVKNTLGETRDISRTIPRRKAQALMRTCLGRHAGEATVLMRLSPTEKASLYLTAHSIIGSDRNRAERTRETTSDQRVSKQNPQSDEPEREVIKPRRPMYLGYINLETGKCSRGRAVATP